MGSDSNTQWHLHGTQLALRLSLYLTFMMYFTCLASCLESTRPRPRPHGARPPMNKSRPTSHAQRSRPTVATARTGHALCLLGASGCPTQTTPKPHPRRVGCHSAAPRRVGVTQQRNPRHSAAESSSSVQQLTTTRTRLLTEWGRPPEAAAGMAAAAGVAAAEWGRPPDAAAGVAAAVAVVVARAMAAAAAAAAAVAAGAAARAAAARPAAEGGTLRGSSPIISQKPSSHCSRRELLLGVRLTPASCASCADFAGLGTMPRLISSLLPLLVHGIGHDELDEAAGSSGTL